MDKTTVEKNWRCWTDQLQRKHTLSPQVMGAGYFSRKTHAVDHTFTNLGISIIISGMGYRLDDGNRMLVTAPCILVQRPGISQFYEPDGCWEELYLIYSETAHETFQSRDFLRETVQFPFNRTPHFDYMLQRFQQVIQETQRAGSGDHLDHAAEALLLSAFSNERIYSECSHLLLQAEQIMREEYEGPLSIDALALRVNLSPSHFRRLWRLQFHCSPRETLTKIRLHQACQQLVFTDKNVASIATKVGYEDPLYFYRVFKKHIGMTALTYRKRYADSWSSRR